MAEHSLEIDGGIMEGGGQILRVCTALSCLLGVKIKIHNIRAGRSTPGLRPQHLSGLQMISDLCDGCLEEAKVGSTEIYFTPGKINGGNHVADTKTAGSVSLLMQVSIPCVLFAASPAQLILRGGTNAEMAPQIDYTLQVCKPIMEKFGFHFDCDVKMRGYYPKGGGEVKVKLSPIKWITPIDMTERGTITKIHGRAFVAGVLPIKLANEMSSAAIRCIRKEMRDIYVNIQPLQEPKDKAYGNGNGIMQSKTASVGSPLLATIYAFHTPATSHAAKLESSDGKLIDVLTKCLQPETLTLFLFPKIIVAETSTGCILAGSALGKRGVSADRVGLEAAEMLLMNLRHGGCVDQYLQDQIIIFMALAKGVSRVRTGPLTLHTQTAIHFAEMLTKAKFTVNKINDQESGSERCIIECEGIGMTNPSI